MARPENLARVVVTGMGLISPLGNSADESWSRLTNGDHGISTLDVPFSYRGRKVYVQAPVRDYTPPVTAKELDRTHRSHHFALTATQEALTDAGFWIGDTLVNIDPTRIGVKIGTGFGGAAEIRKVSAALQTGERLQGFPALVVELERVSTVPSMRFGLRDCANTVVAACATGLIAIGEAYNRIVLGDADAMITGATEAILGPETFAIYAQVGALSENQNPNFASTPFDINRSGFVAGEGAGILVLENLEHAKNRGANILAEIVGIADTSDAADPTAPATEGQVRAIRQALMKANIQPEDINYINAHGTGTKIGDKNELISFETVFGQNANSIPISSLKWQLGHLIGAAGSAEAVLTIKMINEGVIIPNFGLVNPLRDDMNLFRQVEEAQINYALKTSFGFGGINAALVIKRWETR